MWRKTKALISCAVTAQLICVFVFAYTNCWFSHAKVLITVMSITNFLHSEVEHEEALKAKILLCLFIILKFNIPVSSVSVMSGHRSATCE